MKKLILMSILMLMTLMVCAQTKVTPKMKKGMKKTYVMEVNTNIAGHKPVMVTSETQYVVSDATSDGYVVDVVVKSVKSDADPNDMMGRIIFISTEMMKDVCASYATDKEGKVTKILNYEDIKAQTGKMVDKLFEGLQVPEGVLSMKTLREQVLSQITEESLLQSLQMNTSPIVLNGKTITTGMQDEFVNEQRMKMKRTYTVNTDGSIQSVSTMNMSKDDMKQMVLAQIEKLMPNQMDMIRQNIDTMLDSGMMKMEMKENAIYTLTDDKWVNTITSELNSETAGQKTTTKTTLRLKK